MHQNTECRRRERREDTHPASENAAKTPTLPARTMRGRRRGGRRGRIPEFTIPFADANQSETPEFFGESGSLRAARRQAKLSMRLVRPFADKA